MTRLLTPEEAARTRLPMLYVRVSRAPEMFDVSEDTLRRAAARGELSIYKRGGGAFVKIEEVSAWIEGRAA